MLSTLEPERAYSPFNLNLVSELAPLHPGAGACTVWHALPLRLDFLRVYTGGARALLDQAGERERESRPVFAKVLPKNKKAELHRIYWPADTS